MGTRIDHTGASKPKGNEVITDASAIISIRTTQGCAVASVTLEGGETVETFIARVTTILNVMFEREPAPVGGKKCRSCGGTTFDITYQGMAGDQGGIEFCVGCEAPLR